MDNELRAALLLLSKAIGSKVDDDERAKRLAAIAAEKPETRVTARAIRTPDEEWPGYWAGQLFWSKAPEGSTHELTPTQFKSVEQGAAVGRLVILKREPLEPEKSTDKPAQQPQQQQGNQQQNQNQRR